MAFSQPDVLASRDYKVFLVDWDATNVLPANTVLYGTGWGTPSGQTDPWVESGYVDGGLHFTSTVERGEIRVDQELDAVLRPATGRDTRMSTNLAQFTAVNIEDATGQGAVTSVAPTTAVRGYDDWDLTSSIDENFKSIGFDIQHPGDDEAVRFIGYKGQVLGSPTFDITAEDKAIIPLELALLPDTSTNPARICKIRNISAIA